MDKSLGAGEVPCLTSIVPMMADGLFGLGGSPCRDDGDDDVELNVLGCQLTY